MSPLTLNVKKSQAPHVPLWHDGHTHVRVYTGEHILVLVSYHLISKTSQVGYTVAHCPHTQTYSLPPTCSLADLSLIQKNLNSPLLT